MLSLIYDMVLWAAPHHPHGGGGGGGEGSILGALLGGVIGMVVGLVVLVSMWRLFAKAGQPGWFCIVPILSTIILLKIAGKPWWWLFLFCVPLLNFVLMILLVIALARNFGQSMGFAVGLLLLPFVFMPILGLGGARYQPVPG